MLNNDIVSKGKSYSLNSFFSNIEKIEDVYQLSEGVFVLSKTGEEWELFWGVDRLDDLKRGLEKIRDKVQNLKIVFRYAGNLRDVLSKKDIIVYDWGYKLKNLNIGYTCDLAAIKIKGDNENIEVLKKDDRETFISMEREIFDSFNVSSEDLENWMESDEYIILVYKEKGKLKGFIIMMFYGKKHEYCFIRNLGVLKEYRGNGLGIKLLIKSLFEAKIKGAKKSMLWVDYDNKIARDLYEKVGYVIDENEAEAIFEV